MTRNLVICVVPTVLAFFAIYWLRRRKKSKHVSDSPSDCVYKDNMSSLECTSSDLDNTLSDASSFTSPINSEKSSETDSPLFKSPVPVEEAHSNSVLTNTEDSHMPYVIESKDFLRIEELENGDLADSEQPFEAFNVENGTDILHSTRYTALQSPNFIKENISFFKSEDFFLSEAKLDKSTNNQSSDFDGNLENGLKQKVVEHENLDGLTSLLSVETKRLVETDCQSSIFDDNSLSYVSDDSESKQLASEGKNKSSISSMLDESSLLSSFCDELEKSSASISPIALLSNPDCNGSSKDFVNLLSLKNSSIYTDIENLTVSTCIENLKESNLDINLKEYSIQVNNCPGSNESCSNAFEKENINFVSQTSESNVKDLRISGLEGNKKTDSLNIKLVQNNLSEVKEPSAIYDDNADCKTLNIDAVVEKESSFDSEASSDIVCHSAGTVQHKTSSFSENKTIYATYASIVNSNISKSSSDAAARVVQRDSSTLNCNDTVNILNTSSEWPLPDSEAASELSSSSKQVNNGSQPPKKFSDIKTNSNFIAADNNSLKSSTGFYQKESRLESSSDEGNKAVKQFKVESNGFLESSKEYVYEFELPQELCGRLIGKFGRNVKSIMEHSNANVFIKHHPYDPLLKVVVVEGHRADVNEALEIIRRKYPPSMFPNVTLVQTNVLSSTGVPMPESLQLHLPEGASCDVILSSLVSAGHFFLQQPTHPTYPSLSTLDQCMINLYSQMDTPLLPQPIEAGVICAAPVYRGWYRAQVVYVCDNSSDCGIKFVDYGGFSQVPISSLRQIRSDFMSLPFQASECYLAQVRPTGGDNWSSDATSVFEELAQGQILQALLVEYADDGIPCVYLYRVQGVSSTFINKELVERGFAEWVGNSNHWDPH